MANLKNLRDLAAYSGDQTAIITAEIMSQENPILDDAHFQPENSDNGDKSRERTSLPEATARKYNQGIQRTKGGVRVVIDPRTEITTRLEIDKSYIDDFGSKSAQVLSDEQMAHRQANGQKVGSVLFYGSRGKDSLFGLAPRYNTLNPAYAASKYVIDASVGVSSPSNLSSIYFVSWGSQAVYLFYPQGSKAGLEEGKLIVDANVEDADGLKMEGYVQIFKFKVGMKVKDYRSVVRIANIDTVKAKTKTVGAGVPDLEACILQALRLIKPNGGRVVAYANADVMSALDLQALGRNGHSYPKVDFGGKLLTNVNGIPFRQQDGILSTEELVTSA